MNIKKLLLIALSTSLATLLCATQASAEGLTITPYAQLKLDAIYDTNAMKTGDIGYSVYPGPSNGTHTDEFTMTANQSRIGLDVAAPSWGSATITGKVEVDFYSPLNTADNRAAPQLRHGYIKMDWQDMKFSILAGQTWDLMEAVIPPTLNYGVMWFAGNIGYRRPQLRATKGFDLGDNELKIEAAITRAMSDSNLAGGATSEDSGSPEEQARVSYAFNLLGGKKTVVGVSGSMGNPRVFSGATPTAGGTSNGQYYTGHEWSAGLDLNMPIMHNLTLMGSLYSGADLAAFNGLSKAIFNNAHNPGGITQGEHGGWAMVSYQVCDPVTLYAGYGLAEIEDPNDSAAGALTKNNVAIVQGKYTFTKDLSAGLEVDQWRSTYTSAYYAMDNRYEASMMLGF